MSAFQILKFASEQALDTAANVLAGATLTFSLTGVSTPTNAYANKDLTTPLANPLSADAAGNFVSVFLDPTITYRIILKSSAGVTLKTWDPANEQLLSQALIGLYLYPRTPAEIAALVTPVNYAYVPLDIRRYGADQTGVADSIEAIKTAILVARALRTLIGATSVNVDIPDGKYKITTGIPLVTGIVLRCASRWSATITCTGASAALYTAIESAGVFTDNLSAIQTQIQDGSYSVENAGLINLLFDHTGTVSGNAPSGAAWDAAVQINGAPHIQIQEVFAASATNNIHGIHVSLSWRSRIARTWTPRQGGHSGGTGLLVDSESNSALILSPFAFGAWAFGIDAGANSITIVEPNVEQVTGTGAGVRLSGVCPRLIGGYYEGNFTDIRLGIAGSPVNRASVERPWCNGASSTYSIDILASVDSTIVDPFFTGTYSTSKFKTTTSASENYGNLIEIHAADAASPGLAGLGLVGGRNVIRVIGEDNDDHRNYAEYASRTGNALECTYGPIVIAGSQVLNTRKTGWTAATGTATRTTFATGSVTPEQLAEHVKALIDDLISHGVIGS